MQDDRNILHPYRPVRWQGGRPAAGGEELDIWVEMMTSDVRHLQPAGSCFVLSSNLFLHRVCSVIDIAWSVVSSFILVSQMTYYLHNYFS